MSFVDIARSFPANVYSIDRDGKESAPKALEDCEYPREAYIFLSFNDRPYAVARCSVTDLGALTASPHFKDKSSLKLPQGTSEADFLAFYLFLKHKILPPMFKDLNVALTLSDFSKQGPPKINPYDPNAAAPLVTLVSAFQLGRKLRYRPFCDFILKGLQSLSATAENPVMVLAKIYGGQKIQDESTAPAATESPDPQLRDWARTWLAVRFPSSDTGQYEWCYGTNLGVLRYHPDWIEKYEKLRASSSPLKDDDETAEQHVVPDNRDIWRATMPAPAQHPMTSAEYQQYLWLQKKLEVEPIMLPDDNIPGLRDGPSLYYPSKSNDDNGLAARVNGLHLRDCPQNPANRTPPPLNTPSYSQQLGQRNDWLRWKREKAIREGLGSHQSEMPSNIVYPQDPQGYPDYRFPLGGNPGSGR